MVREIDIQRILSTSVKSAVKHLERFDFYKHIEALSHKGSSIKLINFKDIKYRVETAIVGDYQYHQRDQVFGIPSYDNMAEMHRRSDPQCSFD